MERGAHWLRSASVASTTAATPTASSGPRWSCRSRPLRHRLLPHGRRASSFDGLWRASLLRRTFAVDVLSCPCGGQRHVLAAITSSLVAQDILRHLGRLEPPSELPRRTPEPQLALALGA